MRKINPVFLLALTATICLACGIILLPRYISRSIDEHSMNEVSLANREDFSFLEPTSDSVVDIVHALENIKRDGSNLKLITSFDQSARINDELLKNVLDQALLASDLGMIPWIGIGEHNYYTSMGLELEPLDYWVDEIRYAKYYSLTCDSREYPNTQEILNFWFLRFSDEKTFDYYFLVDAATYHIFYTEIYNQYTEQSVMFNHLLYGYTFTKDTKEVNTSATTDYFAETYFSVKEWFPEGCTYYYEAYDYRSVRASNLTNKLALVVLNLENESLYMEQLAMPASKLDYRGISIGFQGVSEKIQNLIKE